jgi:hypothetical protein
VHQGRRSMRAPWWTSAVGGRRRSARREIAPGSCSLAPAATKGCVCATHARRAGAPVRRLGGADHSGGSRRDESPGALSGCAKRRRAPHRVGPPPRSSTRSISSAWMTVLSMCRPGRHHSATLAAAPRVSFAATSDSRDSRSCKARLKPDCRAGLGTQRGSRRTMPKAQLFHATSAGARTRCAARLPPCRRTQ